MSKCKDNLEKCLAATAAIEEKDFTPGPEVAPNAKNTAATTAAIEEKDFKPGPEVEPKQSSLRSELRAT